MKFLFLSVKHSGLRLCKNHVFKDFPSEYRHFEEHPMGELHRVSLDFDAVIIPMRDPMAVAQSWANRGYLMEPLIQGLIKLANFAHTSHHYVFHIPIDSRLTRDVWLTHIENKFDIALNHDWPLVTAGEHPKRKIPNDVYEEVRDLYNWQFFEEWYP